MAGDFLQSNRHSSLLLTEGLLRRIRLKMAKMSDERFRKLDKESHQAPNKDPCDRGRSEVEDHYAHQHENNDYCNSSLSSLSKIGTKDSGTTHDAQDENSTSNMNMKNDVDMKNVVTRPKLKTNLPQGVVWIPKPPNNPKVTHSSNSNSSNGGGEQMGGSLSKNPIQNAIMDTSPENDLSVNDQMTSESCFQVLNSQDHSLQSHLSSDQSKQKEIPNAFISEESSSKNDDKHQKDTDDKIILTMINHKTILTGFYSDEYKQEDHDQDILCSEYHHQKLPLHTKDDDIIIAHSIDNENENNIDIVKEVLPKIQPGLDDESDKNGNSSNCAVNDLFNTQIRQSLGDERSEHLFVEWPENIIHSEGNMTRRNTTKMVDIVSNDKSLSKKNQFLSLVQLLFNMRLKRTDREEDDMEPLVEKEILNDVTARDETQRKVKKCWSCRLSLFGHGGGMEKTKHINPSPTHKKKERRQPKKEQTRGSVIHRTSS